MITQLILVLSLSLLTACVADGKQLVDTDSAQTLTNKTIGATNTITLGSGVASLGGNFTITGAYATTLTVTGTTGLTLPTTGTLATLAGTEVLSNKTLGATAFTGAVTSSKACGTGFTRTTPNFCRASVISQQTWTPAVAVTAHYVDSNIPDGSQVMLRLHLQALSDNAVALRQMYALFYTNAGGGTQIAETKFSVYEHVGVAAGTVLGESQDLVILPTSNSGYVYVYSSETKGNGNAYIDKVSIVGYFD